MTEEGIILACCNCPCMKTLINELKVRGFEFQVSHTMCQSCIDKYYGTKKEVKVDNIS